MKFFPYMKLHIGKLPELQIPLAYLDYYLSKLVSNVLEKIINARDDQRGVGCTPWVIDSNEIEILQKVGTQSSQFGKVVDRNLRIMWCPSSTSSSMGYLVEYLSALFSPLNTQTLCVSSPSVWVLINGIRAGCKCLRNGYLQRVLTNDGVE